MQKYHRAARAFKALLSHHIMVTGMCSVGVLCLRYSMWQPVHAILFIFAFIIEIIFSPS